MVNVRRFLLILLAAALLPLQVNALGKKDASASGTGTVPFTDSAGRTVEVPAKITRIVASGSLAQMFLTAVAPDMLCAISGNWTAQQAEFIPAYIQKLPVVGQFYGTANLNPEEIARIAPDIVIDIGESKASIAADMDAISESIAIPVVHIAATLETSPQAFRTLGRLLGRAEKGEAVAAFCDKILAGEKSIMAKVGKNKKSALYCLGKSGLNVLAASSFHAEILDAMTDNKAVVKNPASRGTGNETDLEQILLWNPDIILFEGGTVYKTVASDRTWSQLKAVKNRTYYEVPFGPYSWMGSPPSINRYLGILWLGKTLYPQYAAYDLYTEVAEYYRLFYGYELSRERFDKLVGNG
jgi:iron complex transport system substrate-binding protein